MTEASGKMPERFDRMLGQLDGLPGMAHTKPATVRNVGVLGVGGSEVYIVQTFRQQDVIETGDEDAKRAPAKYTVFLETLSDAGAIRLVIPPAVADVIARQRDALTNSARRKSAKAAAATRKARGFVSVPPKRKRK